MSTIHEEREEEDRGGERKKRVYLAEHICLTDNNLEISNLRTLIFGKARARQMPPFRCLEYCLLVLVTRGMARLPPIFYHSFSRPLPYRPTLALQERIHALQLSLRSSAAAHPDLLLLLQHRPTYTSGRRQSPVSLQPERHRLESLGADFVSSSRGGQLTYHGPGQIVGYPLIDLSRYSPTMGARDYVCRIQKLLESHLRHSHAIPSSPSEHTGIFLDPLTKIASIGVQVRHRLTSHGFAINITNAPIPWFNQIVACGLDDVKAGSIQSKLHTPVDLHQEIPGIIDQFGKYFQRDMVKINLDEHGEIGDVIKQLEKEAEDAGSWLTEPMPSEPLHSLPNISLLL